MKNKIKYILPRLIGITAIVGIVSFLIVAIFKILVMVTILAALGTWIASRAFKRRGKSAQLMLAEDRSAYPVAAGQMSVAIVPVSFVGQQRSQAIIPVH